MSRYVNMVGTKLLEQERRKMALGPQLLIWWNSKQMIAEQKMITFIKNIASLSNVLKISLNTKNASIDIGE